MARHLPPLPSLRSFEAAARKGSFKKAADELHVTPSAISHAVQSLEDYLGVRLFHRQTRKLVMTDAARQYVPVLRLAFDKIAEASEIVMAQGKGDILTIAAAPNFARMWLLRRLEPFITANPHVDVRIVATMEPIEHLHGEADIAIIYGDGNWPGYDITLLHREKVVPVCTPELAAGPPPLNRPEDLVHHKLIHSEVRLTSWAIWLEANGIEGVDSLHGLRFNRASLAIDAALNGLGVALEGVTAASRYLDEGRLIVPFGWDGETNAPHEGYYLGLPSDRAILPKVAAFRDWIKEVAAEAGPI